MDEKQLLLELDYTPWACACKDPYCTDDQQLVLCRRQINHSGSHATRRGADAIIWEAEAD